MAGQDHPRTQVPEDLGYTDEHLGSNHICLIYDSDDERRYVMCRYLAAGLRQGDSVRYFTDTTPAPWIRSWMRAIGVEVEAVEERGAFVIGLAVDAYCPNGVFDPEEMIARIVRSYEASHRAGFTGSRNVGEMTWVHRGFPGSQRFLEYEAKLNAISTPYRHTGMCQYDARRFDGAALFRVLEVHPFMVSQGQIVRNPYYRRPGEDTASG